MGLYIYAFSTLIFALGLVVIYKKSDKNEDLLILKLVCCYFLGSFRINFSKLVVPLGFLIYLAFFRPKTNIRSKRYAALLGLLFLIIGYSTPFINNYLYERPKEITAKSLNLGTLDFQSDWQLIKEKIVINCNTRLEDFSINYKSDGTINELRYELISNRKEELTHYFVNLSPQKGKYIIRAKKIEQLIQYNRLITAGRFFRNISLLDLTKMKPEGLFEWYSATSSGELTNYAIEKNAKFQISSDSKIRKICNEELPVKGYYISLYGMKKDNNNSTCISYKSDCETDYIFDVINH